MTDVTKLLGSEYLAPVLKKLGFKKKGHVWNRSISYGSHVIDLQSSRQRVDGSTDVTVNVGVFVGLVWKNCWDKPLPPFVKEEHCYPRFRLGHLLADFDPKQRDRWWKISDSDVVGAVGSELSAYLLNECEQYFSGLKAVKDVCSLVESSISDLLPLERIQRAILYYHCGMEEEAKGLLQAVACDEYWHQKVGDVRTRLGVVK